VKTILQLSNDKYKEKEDFKRRPKFFAEREIAMEHL